MPRIPIISSQKKPAIPKSSDMNAIVPRCKPAGGKPPLPLTKSFNTQGPKKK